MRRCSPTTQAEQANTRVIAVRFAHAGDLTPLGPYKPAIEVLRRELVTDPLTAACAAGSLMRSMRWLLAAADIATGGMRGAIAVKLTAAAYLSTMGSGEATTRRISGARWPCWTHVCGGSAVACASTSSAGQWRAAPRLILLRCKRGLDSTGRGPI